MVWRDPSCGGRNFENKLRSTLQKKKKKREFSRVRSVSSCEKCVMPACESKLASRSSRKATVVKTVFVE